MCDFQLPTTLNKSTQHTITLSDWKDEKKWKVDPDEAQKGKCLSKQAGYISLLTRDLGFKCQRKGTQKYSRYTTCNDNFSQQHFNSH